MPSSSLNFLCKRVDVQVAAWLHHITVDPAWLPKIRELYVADVGNHLKRDQGDNQNGLKMVLDEIQREETRAARLYAAGRISDEVYEDLWREWQDRRARIKSAMAPQQTQQHIESLDAALTLIAKTGILFEKLDQQGKRDLLLHMVERVVINLEGTIVDVKLRTPFSYLSRLIEDQRGLCRASGTGNGSQTSMAKNETGAEDSACSKFGALSGPSRIRTCNQPVMSREL